MNDKETDNVVDALIDIIAKADRMTKIMKICQVLTQKGIEFVPVIVTDAAHQVKLFAELEAEVTRRILEQTPNTTKQ